MKRFFFLLTFIAGISLSIQAQPYEAKKIDGLLFYLDHKTSTAILGNIDFSIHKKLLKIPRFIKVGNMEYTVTQFFNDTFQNPYDNTIEEVIVPETVQKIPAEFFSAKRFPNLKKIVFPANAPRDWFIDPRSVLHYTKAAVLEFVSEPEHVLQIGNVLYSPTKKTIYDIRNLTDTVYFVPETVDSIYINFSFETSLKPSNVDLVLSHPIQGMYNMNEYSNSRIHVVQSTDETDLMEWLYKQSNSWFEPILSFNENNNFIKKLSNYMRKEFIKKHLYKDKGDFTLNLQYDTEAIEDVTLDYLYTKKTPHVKNKHLSINIGNNILPEPHYIPMKVTAKPKKRKRIVGFVYFNDTIVNDTHIISGTFTKQNLKVLTCNEGEFIENIDYRLSQNKNELYKWHCNDSLTDLRPNNILKEVTKLKSYSLELGAKCHELFLPEKVEEIERTIVERSTELKTLAFPATITKIDPDAWNKIYSIKNLYFPKTPPIDISEITNAFALQLAHLKHFYVDAEALDTWKSKFPQSSPILNKIKGVPQDVTITNQEADKIIVTVRRLDNNTQYTLDNTQKNITVPRTTPIRIHIAPRDIYDLQKLVLNDEEQQSTIFQTFLLEDLNVTSRGETIKFQLKALQHEGGSIQLTTLNNQTLESTTEVLRGTKIRLQITVAPHYTFKYWTFNNAIFHCLDTVFEVQQHATFNAVFYRQKALVDLSEVDNKYRLTLKDEDGTVVPFERLFVDDVVFLQEPELPEELLVSAVEVNGEPVTQYPHEITVAEKLTIKATTRPRLRKITLSPKAQKYVKITDIYDNYITGTEVPHNTTCKFYIKHEPHERIHKVFINGVEYLYESSVITLTIDKDITLDLEIETIYYTFVLEFPAGCKVAVNNEVITESPYTQRVVAGTKFKITAESTSSLIVKGFDINFERFLREKSIDIVLDRDLKVFVNAVPRRAKLVFQSTGHGKIDIWTSQGKQQVNNVTIQCGTQLTITPIPEQEYECSTFQINGVAYPPKTTKLVVEGDLDIQAEFQPYTYEEIDGLYVNRRTQEVVGINPTITQITINLDQDLSIASNAFNGNSELTEVSIQKGITAIGTNAFFGSALKMIHIGACVTSIANDAFSNCKKLKLVELEHTDPKTLDVAESGLGSRNFLLRVPNGCAESFRTTAPYSHFDVIEQTIPVELKGIFADERQGLPITKCEYWQTKKSDYTLIQGETPLPGGSRLFFANKKHYRDSITALYIDDVPVNLPYAHILLQPVSIRVETAQKEEKKPMLTETANRNQILIKPNPASDFISVQTEQAPPIDYRIVTENGIVVRTGVLTEQQQTINIQKLGSGIYWLQLLTDEQHNQSISFVKE